MCYRRYKRPITASKQIEYNVKRDAVSINNPFNRAPYDIGNIFYNVNMKMSLFTSLLKLFIFLD